MSRLQDVILRGTAGARPAASAVPFGTLYYSTDTQILERSNSSAWESYSAVASSGDVTGPASSLDQAIVLFDGTTGKVLKDSAVLVSSLAPKASPALTGTPTAPTAAPGTNTTQIATTAFVAAATAAFGDVVGPGSAVNNGIALFDGTTGKLIKDSTTLLSALATLASPTFTGTPAAPTAAAGTNTTQIATTAFVIAERLAARVVALVDGATVAIDVAARADRYKLTAGGDRTLSAPTNPTDGQNIVIEHNASGANRTLTLDTGAGGFRFGTDITGLTVTTSGKSDYIGAKYSGAASKWDVIAYVKGY